MTEYSRDTGIQLWYPEDPLHEGRGHDGQQYPQQPHYGQQQQQYGWDFSQDAGGTYAGDAYGQRPAAPSADDQQDSSASQKPQRSHIPQQALRHQAQSFDEHPGGEPEPGGEELSRDRDRDRRGKDRKRKKDERRSGTTCLLAAVVLLGAVGGGGYFAYDYVQAWFGAAPDYEGEGSGQVTIEIPKGAGIGQMGEILQKAGVVKSASAFTVAAGNDPKGSRIQPGIYTLHKEMSSAAAVKMMTDTDNFLTVPEGRRAVQIYAEIDQKLGLPQASRPSTPSPSPAPAAAPTAAPTFPAWWRHCASTRCDVAQAATDASAGSLPPCVRLSGLRSRAASRAAGHRRKEHVSPVKAKPVGAHYGPCSNRNEVLMSHTPPTAYQPPKNRPRRTRRWVIAGLSVVTLGLVAWPVMSYYEIPPFTDEGEAISFDKDSGGEDKGSGQASDSKALTPLGSV